MTPELSEALIRELTLPESFRRGQEYERHGAVTSLRRLGDVLLAQVEGSLVTPYMVRIDFDELGVAAAECTCPYDWGGWCKHVVAALLTYLHQPSTENDVPPFEEALRALSREQLQTVILRLIEHDPFFADAVAAQLELARTLPTDQPSSAAAATPAQSAPIDTQSVRRRVQAALHGLDRMRRSEAYWHVGGVVREVEQVLDSARRLVEAGDGRAALAVLEAITEEYVEGWTMLDDSDGEAGEFFIELGPIWTEALLSADLTATEREVWVDVLANWADEIADYGVDYAFDSAIAAATQGWDYPPLLRAMRGEITEAGAWDDIAPDLADELAIARLNVLERQGRFQEYLYLAAAEGQAVRYAAMLVRLGSVAEAVEYGLSYFVTTEDALTLANALLEQGYSDEAVRIAEHGLTLQGPRAMLAIWLRELATKLDRIEQALPAAVIACREQPALSNYRAVQDLSGDDWPNYRDELLTALRRESSRYIYGAVDVFLYERLFQDAIDAVEGTWDHALIERVVVAVMASHPGWVISTSIKQAESIMNRGDAQNYDRAVHWLTHAREAHRVLGQEAEWTAYLEGLIDTHKRKYKLRPMLEALRR